MPDVHGATMAAIAGLKPRLLLRARMGVLALTAVVAAAVSLATTALVFHADSWPIYAAANLLLAFTYGLIGALLAPIFGRVGGVFIAFLLPFLDIGVVQSPMLHSTPTALSQLLPGYGGSRVLLDGALTNGFDETRPLLIGLAWLVALGLAVVITYRQSVRPSIS